jgi:hypothetical protein
MRRQTSVDRCGVHGDVGRVAHQIKPLSKVGKKRFKQLTDLSVVHLLSVAPQKRPYLGTVNDFKTVQEVSKQDLFSFAFLRKCLSP